MIDIKYNNNINLVYLWYKSAKIYNLICSTLSSLGGMIGCFYFYMKICSRCNLKKKESEFYSRKNRVGGYMYHCKKCENLRLSKKRKTEQGVIADIYNGQKKSSIRRKHPVPNYSLTELKEWVLRQENWSKLYKNWVKSDYCKDLKPSIDRLDDYKGYAFDNIRLVTWKQNRYKLYEDLVSGKNKKNLKSVIQKDLNGNILNKFYSIQSAVRYTGVFQSNISKVCLGIYHTAGGFKWEYAK